MVVCLMVLWFYGFVALLFYGVLFLGFKNYQISISCFQGDIYPAFQDIPEIIRRIFGNCRCPSFPKSIKHEASEIWRFINNNILESSRGVLDFC